MNLWKSTEATGHKYFLFFIPIFAIAIALFASRSIENKKIELMNQLTNEGRVELAHFESGRIQSFVQIKRIGKFLKKYGEVSEVIKDQSFIPHLEQELTVILSEFTPISHFRILNLEGMELFHMYRDNQNQVVTMPEKKLQDKSKRDYFIEVSKIPNDEILISHINLNREFGKLDVPYNPTIRIVAPVVDEHNPQKRIGYISINFNYYKLIQDYVQASEHSNANILNEEGYWVMASKPYEEYLWAFEFADKQELHFHNLFPEISQRLKSENHFLTKLNENLYAYFFQTDEKEGHQFTFFRTFDASLIYSPLESFSRSVWLFSIFAFAMISALIYILVKAYDQSIKSRRMALINLENENKLNSILRFRKNISNFGEVIDHTTRTLSKLSWLKLNSDIYFIKSGEQLADCNALISFLEESKNQLSNDDMVFKMYLSSGLVKFVDENSEFVKNFGRSFVLPLNVDNTSFGALIIPVKDDFKFEIWHKSFFENLQEVLTSLFNTAYLQERMETQNTINAENEKFASLGIMAGGIAHEINNPLGIIRGFSDIIRKKSDDEAITRNANKIVQQIERIHGIINGLLKLSHNDKNIERTRFQIRQLIEDVIPVLENKLKYIQFTCADIPPSYYIYGNEIQLGQVVFNVLNNALQAIEDYEEKWLKIRVDVEDEFYLIRIIDSGKGIDSSIIDKVTQPFFTTKEVGKGTGLGLSIVRKIIEDHDGLFYYVKYDQQNTSFVIKLPKSKAQSSNQEDNFQKTA